MNGVVGALFSGRDSALGESVLLAFVFAFLGYRMSVHHRAARGVTPWRLPSIVWALICLLLQFIGIAIEIVAELTTRPSLPPQGASATPQRLSPYLSPSQVVARPAIGGTGDDEATPAPSSASRWPLPPTDPSGRPPLFGWYPDPTGRHGLRYFDGRSWSALALDDGTLSDDPLE